METIKSILLILTTILAFVFYYKYNKMFKENQSILKNIDNIKKDKKNDI